MKQTGAVKRLLTNICKAYMVVIQIIVEEFVARQQGQSDYDIRDYIHVEDIPDKLAEQYGYDYQVTYRLLSEQELRGDDALQGVHMLLQLSGVDIKKEVKEVIQKPTY